MRISDWSSDVCSSDLLVRQRATEDEAACFDAHHLVDARAGKRLYHLVDGLAEAARILQQGGDVAENDTRLRIIRDGPDLVLDPLHGCQQSFLYQALRMRPATASSLRISAEIGRAH